MICSDCSNRKGLIAGAAFTRWTCRECKTSGMHHNTAVPVVCDSCSKEKKLCTKCGKPA